MVTSFLLITANIWNFSCSSLIRYPSLPPSHIFWKGALFVQFREPTIVYYSTDSRQLTALIFVTWLIHLRHDAFTCGMTHLCVTCLIYRWRDSLLCDIKHAYMTRLIHMRSDAFIRDMTHSSVTRCIYMRHVLFMCDMKHSVWHDSFICDMTRSYLIWLIYTWHDSFECDMTYSTWIVHTRRNLFTRDMPHPNATCGINVWNHSFTLTWLIYDR